MEPPSIPVIRTHRSHLLQLNTVRLLLHISTQN